MTVDRERRSAGHRVKQAVAAVAVTSVVVGVGAAAASTRALPGDTLYGLKRQVENVQLALAQGDVGHGRELLEQADARLGEAEALAAGEDSTSPQTRERLAGALADMDAAVTAAAVDLTRAYRETGDEEPLQLLAQFVAEQQDRLDDLLPLLDPQLRDEVRVLQDRLAELGEQTSSLLGLALEGTSTTGGVSGGTSGRAARRSTEPPAAAPVHPAARPQPSGARRPGRQALRVPWAAWSTASREAARAVPVGPARPPVRRPAAACSVATPPPRPPRRSRATR